MVMNRAAIFSVVAIVIAVLIVAIGVKARKTAPNARPPERVTFAVASLPGSTPALIAQRNAIFETEGLVVELKFYDSGKEALAAMLRGDADLATVADLPIVLTALEGADIRILATICKSGRENSIVARKDRGIITPAQVRGKVVGVIPGTTSEFLLDEFLIMHGIPRSAITVVDLKPGEIVDALVTARVDAVSSWGQYTANLLKILGDNGVRFFGEETYRMYWNVVATRDFVVGHNDAIRNVVKALDRANSYMMNNDDAAQRVAMESFGLDSAQLKELWTDYEFALSLDQTLLLTLESQARWAMKQKKSPARQMPDFRGLFYLDALQSVAPSAVTVIRYHR